jgi:hypothetical protein
MPALCVVFEPNAIAPPRSTPCEAGLRAVLGYFMLVLLPSTPRAFPFRSRLSPLTVAPPLSWHVAMASALVCSQMRMPREPAHA